jgi:hypothetical protein
VFVGGFLFGRRIPGLKSETWGTRLDQNGYTDVHFFFAEARWRTPLETNYLVGTHLLRTPGPTIGCFSAGIPGLKNETWGTRQKLFPKLGYTLSGETELGFRVGLRFLCYEKRLG